MAEAEWPAVAVLGAGAVGCYFGGMFARAGAPVTLIGRRHHVEAITRDGLFLESIHFRQHLAVSASTDAMAARNAQLVLLCVKTTDTEEAARSLAPHLAAGAALISLQNGVDNVERIDAASSIAAIPAVVYVAAEMTAPGRVKHTGRGDLVIGNPPGGRSGQADPRRLEYLAALFGRAGVPCRVSENIQADLWTKLIMNCAYNAISALSRARYGRIPLNPWTHDIMRLVVDEAVRVAGAAGIPMVNTELFESARKLGAMMPVAVSSTAQDLGLGKHTEIDSLNGYVARRGAELGIPTPANQTLHALVKLLEESASGEAV